VLSQEAFDELERCLKTKELTYEDTSYETRGGRTVSVKHEVTKADNRLRARVFTYRVRHRQTERHCYGLHGNLQNRLEVLGRKFQVQWAVSVEDGSVSYSLDNCHGTVYLLQKTEEGTLRAVNKRTGRPPSGPLKKVRFARKREGIAVVGTAQAEAKEGWHGSAFYG
jgi:hypothetical protein